MNKPKIALFSEIGKLGFPQLRKAVVAFQKQISRDFKPVWRLDAEIIACKSAADVPKGAWPIAVRKESGVPGAAAYHDVKKGVPFSVVEFREGWTLSASHQIMEMVACPDGNRTLSAPSIRPGETKKRVNYLVQVCDPCQGSQWAYSIDGVLVSDFYTPHFFDETWRKDVRYDHAGHMRQPREVLRDGYISWFDPSNGHWWQRVRFGKQDSFRDLGVFQAEEKPARRKRPARPEARFLTVTQTIALFQQVAETKEQRWLRETSEWIAESHFSVSLRRPWRELVPKSLEDLYSILNRIADSQLYVFRGHADRHWEHLITSLHRILGHVATPGEQAKLEAEGITAFRRHARSLLPTPELAYLDRILDGVTLMQHYGAPTRLLDWTLSPWVAAYFATSDRSVEEQDGVIWAFNQARLVKNYFENLRAGKPQYPDFEALVSATSVEDWLNAALVQTGVVNMFRYQYANAQMGAQQSLFTICGSTDVFHEAAIERVLRDEWDKLRVRVPAQMKNTLQQRLFRMNVSALSLFPSIDGVGRHISEALRCGFPLGDEGLLYLLEKKQSVAT